jgi:hypothetical protein
MSGAMVVLAQTKVSVSVTTIFQWRNFGFCAKNMVMNSYHKAYGDRNSRDGASLVASGYVANPWNAWQSDKALTLRFDPAPNFALKLEGHLEEGTWLLSESSGAEKKNWYIFATKATFSF